ncbi:MAG: hypothetical protein ACI910_000869 [Oleispira sp.]|jgi:hypothetical protein
MLLSPFLLFIITSATLLISASTLTIAWRQYGLRQQCESYLLHVSSHQTELALLIENQLQLLETQEILEDTIDTTTSIVRTLHKGIAAIPFGILENIAVTRHTTQVVRGTHDLISDVVYSSISIVNKTSGNVIRKGIGTDIGKVTHKDIDENEQ